MDPPRVTRRRALAVGGGTFLPGYLGGVRAGAADPPPAPDGPWPQLGGSPGHAGAGGGTARGATGFDAGTGAPAERWATRLDGPAAAPTVVGDTAYTARGVPADGADGAGGATADAPLRTVVEAYALDSGDRRWSLPLSAGGAPVPFPAGAPAARRPVSHRGRLFASVGDRIAAVDPAAPERVWTSDPAEGLRFTDPPTVTDAGVYAGGPFGLAAFDHDGGLRWAFPEGAADGGAPPPGSPRVAAAVDGAVYVPLGDALVAVDPADGSERWRHERAGARASAVVGSDDTLVRAGADRVEAVGTDGERRWVADWPGAAVTRPAVDDDAVYLAGPAGYVAAYGRADGERRWLTRVGPERYAEGTVATVGGGAVHLLRVDTGTRTVRAVALDPADGSVAWTVERPGTDARGVVPAGEYLLFTTGGTDAGAGVAAGTDAERTTLRAFGPRSDR